MIIKTVENMFRKLIFALLVVSIVSCGSKPRVALPDDGGLKPSTQHQIIAKEVSGLLENASYKKVKMNDSISGIIYDNLIKSLDQGKITCFNRILMNFKRTETILRRISKMEIFLRHSIF
jgi:predicted small lipoprotein YifL